MKTIKKSAIAQPECRVIRFGAGDVISTSGPASARSGANEEYEVVNTQSIWF